MKTIDYNPSTFEVTMAQIIADMQNQIQSKMEGVTFTKIERELNLDNPRVKFTLKDSDGDTHKLTVQVVQTIDEF